MTNYYAILTGGSGSGTLASPFKTASEINAVTWNSGDILSFVEGYTHVPDRPITLRGLSAEKPLIVNTHGFNKASVEPTGLYNVFNIDGTGVTFERLVLAGKTGISFAVINVTGSSDAIKFYEVDSYTGGVFLRTPPNKNHGTYEMYNSNISDYDQYVFFLTGGRVNVYNSNFTRIGYLTGAPLTSVDGGSVARMMGNTPIAIFQECEFRNCSQIIKSSSTGLCAASISRSYLESTGQSTSSVYDSYIALIEVGQLALSNSIIRYSGGTHAGGHLLLGPATTNAAFYILNNNIEYNLSSAFGANVALIIGGSIYFSHNVFKSSTTANYVANFGGAGFLGSNAYDVNQATFFGGLSFSAFTGANNEQYSTTGNYFQSINIDSRSPHLLYSGSQIFADTPLVLTFGSIVFQDYNGIYRDSESPNKGALEHPSYIDKKKTYGGYNRYGYTPI